MFDHIVAEAVREDFARQRRDRDPRAFPFQYVAEVLEVRVAAPDGAVLELEGGDVGAAYYFVVRVHVPGSAMGLRVFDLVEKESGGLVSSVRWD